MKRRALRIWLGVLLGIGLVGCATAPPEVFYTLSPLPTAAKGEGATDGQPLAIGVGPIALPAFLDRSQLVTRSGSGVLTVDEQHRWAGSLEDDFSRVLGENLAQLLATSRILHHTAEVRYPLDFRLVAGGPGGRQQQLPPHPRDYFVTFPSGVQSMTPNPTVHWWIPV